VRSLTAATGGLVGERDPAQPLLTLLDGSARVELSGATTANWVAKTAHLLVDGLGEPDSVGVLLPLHWQTLVVVLAGVATGATVVVASSLDELAGCDTVFTTVDRSAAAVGLGIENVLAVSDHPLGLPPGSVPPLVIDHAREVPGYGDSWPGRAPRPPDVVAGRVPLPALPALGLTSADRVLVAGSPSGADRLALLLGSLAEAAALVLLPDPAGCDVPAVARQESVTATAGVQAPGVRRLD
jgi:uncharacterized protein (TIGR03089 family)